MRIGSLVWFFNPGKDILLKESGFEGLFLPSGLYKINDIDHVGKLNIRIGPYWIKYEYCKLVKY